MSDIPVLRYEWLFEERQIRSVTANTRKDGEEFLEIAARIPIRPVTTPYRFDEADRALMGLAEGRVKGAAVLQIS
jgi:propanol-preferring alcohol dehydrogenase